MPKPKPARKSISSKRLTRRPSDETDDSNPFEESEFNLRLFRWRLSGGRAVDDKEPGTERLTESARRELLQNAGNHPVRAMFSDEIEDDDGRNVSARLVEEGAEAAELE